MITAEVTDLIYKEAREKIATMTLYARVCFCCAAIVVVPLFLFMDAFVAPILERLFRFIGDGLHAALPNIQLAVIVSFLLSLSLVSELTEKKLIPLFTGMAGKKVFDIETVKSIARSEIPILEHVVRKATTGHRLVRVDIDENQPTKWRYQYSFWVKYALLILSSIVLTWAVVMLRH
ncbi:hypothetical protein [Caballeronia humi]|uniref:Uncharacterized protein n=1 Tax=Caballeronia humi TaxID=326474 RepID=A0A158G7S4_9BURK|nr:hypothetical protein [Caballeronia humi]SAL28165.1 hypothetical protein AWB65_01662 [Caballeronia humi]